MEQQVKHFHTEIITSTPRDCQVGGLFVERLKNPRLLHQEERQNFYEFCISVNASAPLPERRHLYVSDDLSLIHI